MTVTAGSLYGGFPCRAYQCGKYGQSISFTTYVSKGENLGKSHSLSQGSSLQLEFTGSPILGVRNRTLDNLLESQHGTNMPVWGGHVFELRMVSWLGIHVTWVLFGAIICTLGLGRLTAGEAADVVFIEGFSQPFRISNVAAATSGIVQELVSEEGAQVHQDECLLRLDDRIHQHLLKIAEANKDSTGELEAAQAELRSNTRRVQVIRELSQLGSATPDELFRAESDYELALANVKTMQEKTRLREAEYEKLLTQADDYRILAPFDGVIVEYLKQKGEFVGPVDPNVVLVAELTTLSVDFLMPRRHRSSISINRDVEVHFVESNRRVVGRVYYISPFPDGETNTYAVKVRVENQHLELNAGERCQLERVLQPRQPADSQNQSAPRAGQQAPAKFTSRQSGSQRLESSER